MVFDAQSTAKVISGRLTDRHTTHTHTHYTHTGKHTHTHTNYTHIIQSTTLPPPPPTSSLRPVRGTPLAGIPDGSPVSPDNNGSNTWRFKRSGVLHIAVASTRGLIGLPNKKYPTLKTLPIALS